MGEGLISIRESSQVLSGSTFAMTSHVFVVFQLTRFP
jgi:hypothetical protein